MTKRLGGRKRNKNDFYPTPLKALPPLIPHVLPYASFFEPCAGDGRLADALVAAGLECCGQTDIAPQRADVGQRDAMSLTAADIGGAHLLITNPPYERDTMHALINHLRTIRPAWFLLESDWLFTVQAAPLLRYCSAVVAVGRLKLIEGSPSVGYDNFCWACFRHAHWPVTHFFGR